MASADEAASVALFTGIGLEENTAKNAVVNAKFRCALLGVIKDAKAENGCCKSVGNLLYYVASKFPVCALPHRRTLIEYVMNGSIKRTAQLDGAFEYCRMLDSSDPLDTAALEESAGIGIVVTSQQVEAAVAAAIAQHRERLLAERYQFNINNLLGQLTKALKWAEGAVLKAELERQWKALLGPQAIDVQKPSGKKKRSVCKAGPVRPEETTSVALVQGTHIVEDQFAFLPKPEANNSVHTTICFSDGRVWHVANKCDKLAAHLTKTCGKVVTRFPPEPNGYLHIGHAKAMFADFGMALQYDGLCYLRFDDTNPEAEKQEYIDHIQEIVAWMGWKPAKISFSSDYFDQLYAYAVRLIMNGNAYVCHQTKEEIERSRNEKLPSPWRNRPIAESLSLFEDMKRGLLDEGEATLRMKMDYANENVNMFDLIAYRIKFVAHPHANEDWCIYPSYDYAHCLVDSLEDITHSLCTLEFESRRASYYWLLEVLDLYKPFVWEYARLNLTSTVMSKRKLNKLVIGGYVKGWDDPRLPTLAGLRRRGVTPKAINNFCHENGLTRNDSMVPMHRLEHFIRLDLDATSPRMLAVLHPLKVIITNMPSEHYEEVEAQTFPGRPDSTPYKVPFTRILYIEQSDFREVDSKDYYGLAPEKTVMLRYAYPITCSGYKKDASGAVTELHVKYHTNYEGKKVPKGVLNWVAQPNPFEDPLRLEVRMYDYLFTTEDPGNSEKWLEELNSRSLHVIQGAFGNPTMALAKVGDRFQLERLGYFAVDLDSSNSLMVLNRTVTLKESFPKFSRR